MRRFWKVLAILVALIALLALASHLYKIIPAVQVQRELERLKRMGEPTNWSDIIKPVPARLDGTPLYRQAFAQLDAVRGSSPSQIWLVVDYFGSSDPPFRINLANVRRALKLAQPALQTFRKAVELPHMRLIDWQRVDKEDMVNNHSSLRRLKDFVHLLRAEALLRKQDGNVDEAVRSCLTVLKLVRRMSDEPLLHEFLVQGSLYATGLATLQQVLRDADASPQIYRQLLAELQAWDIDHNLVQFLKMERVLNGIAFFSMLRSTPFSKLLKDLSIDENESNLAVWFGPRSYISTGFHH